MWIKPRAAKRSSSGWAAAIAVTAPSASFACRALSTFLTEVRSMERWLLLRALRTMVCLARFLADLILATMEPSRNLERMRSRDARQKSMAHSRACVNRDNTRE